MGERVKTRPERQQQRADALGALEERPDAGYQQALAALARVHTENGGRQAIHVRRRFFEVPMDAEAKPPATLLVSPRGHSLRMALLVLFVAQSKSGPDHHVLKLKLSASASDEVAWVDLLMTPAKVGETSAGKKVLRRRADSARAALKKLADPGVSFIELPESVKQKGAYDEVRLFEDVGPRSYGPPVRYTVPQPSEPTIAIPVDFFLKGWIYVLEDTEILTYLMYRSLCARTEPAHISAHDRECRFGIGSSAWERYNVLENSGLLTVEHAVGRRDDGTFEGQASGATPERHHFSLKDAGLAQDAVPAVREALCTISPGPIGIAQMAAP